MPTLFSSHPEFNDWTVVSLTRLPPWAVALVVVLLVGSVVLAHLGLRGETRRGRRIVLTSLRAFAVLCAVFLILEPAIQLLQVRRVKNRVAVLLDTSSSMALPAGGGDGTRLDAARAVLSDTEWFRRHADRFVFEWATFDSGLYPSEAARLAATEDPSGHRTDLLSALRAVASGTGTAGGRRLAGVVLLTDAADTESLMAGVPPDVRQELEALGAPVHVLLAGKADTLKDLAVVRILSDDFAFVRNAVEVEAVIQGHGFEGEEVAVVLRREGRILSSQTVRLSDRGEARAQFRFTPDTTGKFVYTVEVPVLQDEAVSSNNVRAFVLKVIRDRIRVLQVAGRPSWDERFLRGLLKRDPNVDLISFFILRSREDSTAVPQNDLSLIPFPVEELFTKELKTFDLVVFQNFDYLPYNMAQYLSNVAAYVKDGGAFVMVGGEQSFSEGRYQGTYIEDVLPVEVLPRGLGTSDEAVYRPRLTEEGRRHPILQLGGSGEGTDRVLASLPDLPGLNLVRRAKPGAQVLLEHPFLKSASGNAPVVVVGEAERGRTMAVTTDATWLWSFAAAGSGGDRRAYDRFWTNAMRWLIRDPDLTNVRVRPVKDVFEPGEPVVLEVSARNREYGPAKGAKVHLEVQGDDGRPIGTYDAVAGDDGTAGFELELAEAGAFKVVAEAREASKTGEGPSLGREVGAFLVRGTSAELVSPAPRPALAQALAEASGGTVYALPRSDMPDLGFVDPEVVEVGRKQNVNLWTRWVWIALLIGAAATEWSLRRRWGHP